jgi:molecular chaperone DnaK
VVKDPIVGIDLGTSNSVVAHADASGVVKVLADDAGYKIHPSVVSFHPNGGVIVGASAKQRKVIDPANTIYSAKRLIGRSYRSPEVQTARGRVPYQIKEGAGGVPLIATRAGEFAIPEISAIVLDHMRTVATTRLGTEVSRAVITVPASFNDAQRAATANAGAIAGLTVLRVLNEPTAAALAYGHSRRLDQVIAVYDFGGGTFDITLLALRDQVYEVLGTAGDTFLGGDDLDERIVDKMVAKFLAEQRIDLRSNEVSMMRLRAVAEQTKIELSRRSRAVVRIDEIAYGSGGAPLDLHIELTRDEFVAEVSDIIDRTFPVCQEALAIAGLGIDGVAEVILVGGTTRIPYVRDQVSRFFQRAPRTDVNPDDAVALGAALQAAALDEVLSRPRKPSRQIRAASSTSSGTFDSLTDPNALGEDPGPGPRALQLDTRSGSVTTVPTDELVTGAPVPPPPPRPSAERPDTSYSLTRGGSRDELGLRGDTTTLRAEPFDPRPPSGTSPLARITKSLPEPSPRKTAFGVPSGPQPPPLGRAAAGATRTGPEQTITKPLLPDVPIAPPQAPTLTLEPDAGSEVTDAGALESSTFRGGDSALESSTFRGGDSALESSTFRGGDSALESSTFRGGDSALEPASTFRGIGAQAGSTVERSTPFGAVAPLAPPTPLAPRPAPVLLEVTPRGLGIATVAGFCEELIRRNSRVPTEMKRVFTTSRDRQDLVRIVVCQGESRRLDQNTVIGDLVLASLPPRPRGETAIEVTFALDASGILQVSARDANTGAEQHASLDLVGGVAAQDLAASRDRVRQLRR